MVTSFFKVKRVQWLLVKEMSVIGRDYYFEGRSQPGVSEDVWRPDDAVEVVPLALCVFDGDGAPEALHPKISVENIWPYCDSVQQPTDSEIVL